MKFRFTDGEGFFQSNNTESGGALVEDGVLGCAHCHATILRADIEKPKTGLTVRARCWACDGYLCPDCGLAVHMHGHGNPEHERTWPHHLWIQRGVDEAYRREQLAKGV